ncbi:hypothetical protein [Bradyrhizobium yuanmingense]|uniref:Phasin domain-containing protein n=1 Tax=Bradyrhizobium yuanmingense TaxID=108015 RepID=A0ABV4G7H4_9BRAD|nr:hypothetical protein [Bradyrhizobium yuanmingense]
MPATIGENEKRERRAPTGPELAKASTSGLDGGADGVADGVGEKAANISRISFTFPEWQKSIEATANLFSAALRDGLKLAASSLHNRANLLKNLADSKSASELLKCYLDFAEQSWSESFSEGSKMLDRLKHSQRLR